MVLRPRGFSLIYVRIGLGLRNSQGKARQARKQSRHNGSKMQLLKCVVNNTEGKEAGKQGRQESKAGAKQAKCGANVW